MRELAYPPKQKDEYNFYGEVIEEVMYEVVKNVDNDMITTEQLIDIASKYLEIPQDEIIEYLHECKSDFVANNEIQGFIVNEKGKMEYIKRLTVFTTMKKMCLEKFNEFPTMHEKVQALQYMVTLIKTKQPVRWAWS